jgi:hypothetical protein
MSNKRELLADLRAEFHSWENVLADKNEAEITARRHAGDWSISDVIGHLRAWQQVSVARLEAALLNIEPDFPAWLEGADPFFAEDHVEDFNARIYAACRDQSWSSLRRDWREGFLRLIESAEAIPEEAMFDAERYVWLKGYALSAVLQGTCEHNREHLESLSARHG